MQVLWFYDMLAVTSNHVLIIIVTGHTVLQMYILTFIIIKI